MKNTVWTTQAVCLLGLLLLQAARARYHLLSPPLDSAQVRTRQRFKPYRNDFRSGSKPLPNRITGLKSWPVNWMP